MKAGLQACRDILEGRRLLRFRQAGEVNINEGEMMFIRSGEILRPVAGRRRREAQAQGIMMSEEGGEQGREETRVERALRAQEERLVKVMRSSEVELKEAMLDGSERERAGDDALGSEKERRGSRHLCQFPDCREIKKLSRRQLETGTIGPRHHLDA
jgi:hypothetical protein